MPEDFYAALMMRRALPTTTNIKTITAPGIYPVDAGNANAPGSAAGALIVLPPTTKPKLKFIKESDTSIYTLIGTDWKKPTATDVDAVAKIGDTMTGRLIMNIDGEAIRLQPKTAGYASYIICYDSANANHWYVGAGSTTNTNVTLLNYKGANNSITLNSDGTVNLNPTQGKSAIVNGPLQVGAVGSAALNIGDNDSGLRSSVDGQVDLWSNSAKVGFWNKTTFSFTGQIIPTNYSNFDARFIIADSASYAGFASNDAARPYMRHKASNAVVELARKGDAYTKTESDGRYNLKNTATKATNAMTSKDASTGVMEVVMSNITVAANTNVSVTFSTAFPSVCVGVVIAYDGTGRGNDSDSSIAVTSYSRTGCVLHAYNANGKFMLIAKGY